MKIGILGVGYVGLVSGVCFSDFGHDVTCYDKDEKKISNLQSGIIPIYEPGLEDLVKKNIKAKRLKFKSSLEDFLHHVEIIFIAVGTPSRRSDGHADLDGLYAVAEELYNKIETNQVLVIKSTVPVGTNKKFSAFLRSKSGKDYNIVSNPEFLREGSAIEDFMKPDRVIVGTNSQDAVEKMAEVYKPLYLRDFPIIYTDPDSAELIKYASNAFLAMKISFINEVALICENSGADISEVAKGIGLDGRIGNKFLHPGPGYGGSCFPKDTLAFAKVGRDLGAPQTIIETVSKVNVSVKLRMIDKIVGIFDGDIDKKIICILGVTFKPNTDDIREAPSLTIIPALQEQNANIRVVDPQGLKEGKQVLKNVEWFNNAYAAADGADLIVILTEWNEFRALDLKELAKTMRTALMVDLRNIYSEDISLKSGFEKYISIGR